MLIGMGPSVERFAGILLEGPEALGDHRGVRSRARAVLATACSIHFVHDGFSDILYVLLPLWATDFGLTFAQVGMIRTAYSGGMAAFQIPAGLLPPGLGARRLLRGRHCDPGARARGDGWRHAPRSPRLDSSRSERWADSSRSWVCCLWPGSAPASSTRSHRRSSPRPTRQARDAPRSGPTTSPATSARSWCRRQSRWPPPSSAGARRRWRTGGAGGSPERKG